MKNKWLLLSLSVLIMISVCTASFICWQRIILEKQNNSVELVMDCNDLEDLSLNEGVPLEKVLKLFKEAGITTLAITESTLIDAEQEGRLSFYGGSTMNTKKFDPNKTYVYAKERKDALIKELISAFGERSVRIIGDAIELSGSQENIFLKGMGVSPLKVALARKLGLSVIPRIKNSHDLTSGTIYHKISSVLSLSPFETVIFDGEEVLGYPNYIKETAQILNNHKVRYGFIELAKQGGDSSLLGFSGMNTIKLHSIPADEMETMRKNAVVQRYVRAAQERSIRMLYIHTYPFNDKDKSSLETNLDIIRDISSSLQKRGLLIGKASAPGDTLHGKVALTLMTLGVSSGSIILLGYFFNVGPLISISLLALTLLSSTVLNSLIVMKMFALIAAVVFPVFAVISQYPAKQERQYQHVLLPSIITVLYMVGITFIGGILIAGILSEKLFFMGINAFSGVKLALVLPVILISSFIFLRNSEGNIDLSEAKERMMGLLNTKITILNASLLLMALSAAALLLLRSGNFGLPILLLEKVFRGILETALMIRPRTKEFIVGYPALLLGTIYYLKGGRVWLPIWSAAGILALVSATNSFCHIHTPFTVTMIRSVYGMVLGLIIGALLYGTFLLSVYLYRKFSKA